MRQTLGQLESSRLCFPARYDACNKAESFCLTGTNEIPGKHEKFRVLWTHEPGDDGRDERTRSYFWLAKLSIFRGNHNIAPQCEF